MKKAHRKLVVLLVVLAMALGFGGSALAWPGGPGPFPGGPQIQAGGQIGGFVDLGHASWATKYIVVLNLEGVLHGVGGGRFEPNHHLTWGQAVTMIDHYLHVKLAAGPRPPLPPVQPLVPPGPPYGPGGKHLRKLEREAEKAFEHAWYRHYVNQALRYGWVTKGHPWNQDINRADFARLVVRALKLPALSQAQISQILSVYPDASRIPANGDRNAVAILTQAGVITGFPDGDFKPFHLLTRAQAAVILVKAQKLEGNQTGQGNVLHGTVTAVSTVAGATYQGTVTVQLNAGPTQTYDVDSNAAIFVNGQASTLSAVPTGDQVTLFLDPSGNVAYLSATAAPAAPLQSEGIVVQTVYAGTAGNQLQIFNPATGVTTATLSSTVVVSQGNNFLSPSQIGVGDRVHLKINQSLNEVTWVIIQQATTAYAGTVQNVTSGGFTLVGSNGTNYPIQMGPWTYIESGGTRTTAASLTDGTAVSVDGWNIGGPGNPQIHASVIQIG